VLWFTNQLEPAFSSIEVRDEKGGSVQAGKAVVDRSNRARMSGRSRLCLPAATM